ncbi:NADH-quinone oxidoreductase subunit A [Mucilaginibacter sp. E4BP6]|uniref:NADH-quinone oxidoreductase subunit A n=1 Tax=Mucilaginibacter sp. E4BP6 TaxID=2723089 RepID=UPI0015CAC5C4|nr:NADH-quinone oxidoreductase subunit A [Mucilaginibacter sp. E4BP6]NYE67075.1 NADH-quinone oxidoreductase subunit A [Mucilaginibacter sp. E4BP6]
MGDVAQISEFGKILIFLITGIIVVCLIFFVNRIFAPNHPNFEKQTSYECGEEPVGSAWLPFNSRFYVIALVFLLFEVEMVFVFPWATVFGSHEINKIEPRWGILSLMEMFIFLGILILGLVYVWVKGDLDWIKPAVIKPTTDVQIPTSLYDKLNLEQSSHTVRKFSMEQPKLPEPIVESAISGSAVARKPMFKPTFKKPENE